MVTLVRMGSSYSQTAVVSGTVEQGYESVRHQFTFYSLQPQCYRFAFDCDLAVCMLLKSGQHAGAFLTYNVSKNIYL